MAIRKEEFLYQCCDKCEMDLTRPQMRAAYHVIMEVARDLILQQNDVQFHGIGTFETSVKPSHEARNPSTGETVVVPDRVMGKFRINQNLKMDLRNVKIRKQKASEEKKEAPAKGKRR